MLLRRKKEKEIVVYQNENNEEVTYTFNRLFAEVEKLAQTLLSLGIAQGDAVVIYTPRSQHTIVGLLAILKIRGIYVPVDNSYPIEQVHAIIKDVNAQMLLTTEEYLSKFSAISIASFCMDRQWDTVQPFVLQKSAIVQYDWNDPALILYTSGSTGKPKGILHSQRQLINRFSWLWKKYPFKKNDTVGQRTMLNFLPSLWGLLGGLLQGVKTVILHNDIIRDPLVLAKAIHKHKISHFAVVPSLLKVLLESNIDFKKEFGSLKFCVTGGEALSPDLCNNFFSHLPKALLLNDYGATEMNGVLYEEMKSEKGGVKISGFLPIPNIRVFILDDNKQLLPAGVEGELHVEGVALALNYINNKELTDRKFINHSFDGKSKLRLYKTGDVASFTTDGKILIKGRKDRQIKVRGIRIEPYGIEQAVLAYPDIRQCVVVLDEKSKTLVAYVVLLENAKLNTNNLMKHLEGQLPKMYLPARIEILPELPKTLSGKVNYAKLKRENTKAKQKKATKLDDKFENEIYEIACQVLDLDAIDKNKKWYAVGFDSISILNFVNKLNKKLKLNISVSTLYSHASIVNLVAYLNKNKGNKKLQSTKVDSEAIFSEQISLEKETEIYPESASYEEEKEERYQEPESLPEKEDEIYPESINIKEEEEEAFAEPERIKEEEEKDNLIGKQDVAIVGVSGKFPGADCLDEFWQNLVEGKNSITSLPFERWQIDESEYSTVSDEFVRPKSGGFLSDVDCFDASFFHISHLEADLMDPQQRLLLEESWKALEDACYSDKQLENRSVGVFVGVRPGDYIHLINKYGKEKEAHSLMGNDQAILAARIAYFLNLKGPAITIDTACSSSGVAMHLACKSIQGGESEVAIVGGVSIFSTPMLHELSGKLGMLSKRGECRPFDKDADGIAPAEGVGVVVLKSLESAIQDKDKIYGVIKSSGINQDGRTNGITAPNGEAQKDLINTIYKKNNILPSTIDYIETHGTGTKLGDPIEIEALRNVYDSNNNHTINIGSVKANIGHPIASAAMAGLFKILFAFQSNIIPPQINFDQENTLLNLSDTDFEINVEAQKWNRNGRARRAALSSFGFSGTNAHFVIEEAPSNDHSMPQRLPNYLICISAQSGSALKTKVRELIDWLNENPETFIGDLAFVSAVGRSHFRDRIAVIASDIENLGLKLNAIFKQKDFNNLEIKRNENNFDPDLIIDELKKEKVEYFEGLSNLAKIYESGENINWSELYNSKEGYQKIEIPTYPFTHTRHWIGQDLKGLGIKTQFEKSSLTDSTEANSLYSDSALWFKKILSEVIKTPLDKIRTEDPLENYGIDSILITRLNRILENYFNKLSKTLFFECQSVGEVARYLVENHTEELHAIIKIESAPKTETATSNSQSTFQNLGKSDNTNSENEIVIIGMAGRYPMANNLDEFFENLKSGKDAVTEIPKERWDYMANFSAEKREKGKIHGKWGGFINDVDKFDSLFFNISPKEAVLMDPQERIFLETVWHTMEDAGYSKSFLNKYKVGVYLGATWSEYKLVALESGWSTGDEIYPNCSLASIANRVSYQFNFSGPSLAIDTMCSSSLTALYYANEALKKGEIDFAFVGGVNLSLHPYKYQLLSSGQFLSTEGKCRSFGEGGDGYVPGEGVGAILLTSKEFAINANAKIYASLKGMALNHGGKTNGYTVPNPLKQSSLITEALKNANIAPDSISYIEAHGTGTSLGDPIEITGLTKSFEKHCKEKNNIAVGSVKSNIGHLEACAGIASITKVLLQMKSKTIFPSIHATNINKNIDFESTPFYLQKEMTTWNPPSKDNAALPRRAAISSFGAGGANAHIILDEFISNETEVSSILPNYFIFLLSAKNKESLTSLVNLYINFIEKNAKNNLQDPRLEGKIDDVFHKTLGLEKNSIAKMDQWSDLDIDLITLNTFNQSVSEILQMQIASSLVQNAKSLSDYFNLISQQYLNKSEHIKDSNYAKTLLFNLTYTLQVGRENMDERLAIVCDSPQNLLQSLRGFANGFLGNNAYQNNTRNNEIVEKIDVSFLVETSSFSKEQYNKLALAWTQDEQINWSYLYKENVPQRISLPLYPFKRKRHWIGNKKQKLFPKASLLKLKNISTTEGICFESIHTGFEFYFKDHQIERQGEKLKIFPGAAYLECVYQAAKKVLQKDVLTIKNIVWEQAFSIDQKPVTTICEIVDNGSDFVWKMKTKENLKRLAQGRFSKHVGTPGLFPSIDILQFKNQCDSIYQKGETYSIFQSNGMLYGDSFQVIEEVYLNEKQVVAYVKLPEICKATYDFYHLHPALLDGAFQTIIALTHYLEGDSVHYMPFSVGEICIYKSLPSSFHVCTKLISELSNNNRVFNIEILNEFDEVCLSIKSFTIKAIQSNRDKPSSASRPMLYFKEEFTAHKLPVVQMELKSENILFFTEKEELYHLFKNQHPTHEVFWINSGQNFQQLDRNTFLVNPLILEDLERLLKTFSNRGISISKFVYHQSALDSLTKQNLMNGLNAVAFPVFQWIKALILNSNVDKTNRQLLFVYDAKDINDFTTPFSAIGGLVKSVNMERTVLNCKCLGIYNNGIKNIVEYVGKELWNEKSGSAEIRYVNNERQTLKLKPFEPKLNSYNNVDFKNGGTYLITGGMGGLGLTLASQIDAAVSANIVLLGRRKWSEEIQRQIERTAVGKSQIQYISCDVADSESIQLVVSKIKSQFGSLNGVIHCAGVMRAAFIKNKSLQDLKDTVAPKVLGTYYLDYSTKDESLDFFILYSSIASVLGSAGQTDYAYANSFLDHYTEYRTQLVKAGKRFGKTLTVNWHLWEEGGMTVDNNTKVLFEKTFGMYALSNEDGWNTIRLGLNIEEHRLVSLKGDKDKVLKALKLNKQKEEPEKIHPKQITKKVHATDKLAKQLASKLKRMVAEILELDLEEISLEIGIDEYGFESVSFTEFANKINEEYGLDFMPSIFFEHSTLNSLVEYLEENYKDKLLRFYKIEEEYIELEPKQLEESVIEKIPEVDAEIVQKRTVQYENEPIAIVGMSGKMPQANSIEEFWEKLEQGESTISEIPEDRWDWKEYDSGNEQIDGKSYNRWGGFLKDIYNFDSAFFSIAPSEARLMDPQHRLVIESVWNTIEDAGYKANHWSGKEVGVFIGVATSDYDHKLRMNANEGNFYATTGNSHSILTNRVSYFFNFCGPSEPVNTACSSSLVAIDKAVNLLRNTDCEMCIAGGVNVILDPSSHVAFSHSGVLSKNGSAKVLDKNADGYIRSEGVGTVMLKRLSDAEADGDHIYGVIQSTNVNHDGKTNSLTSPNPNAQASLIVNAFKKANFEPATVSFLELQGIGLPLADAIEINGLKKAFNKLYEYYNKDNTPNNYCGLGTVKSNVGHLEAASGMASLFKTLLCFKYNKILKNINIDQVNPEIKLNDSPFYIVKENTKWNNTDNPLRAGISAFGFGGVNAHILLEKYETQKQHFDKVDFPLVFVLSAKSTSALFVYLEKHLNFLESDKDIALNEYLYTLQVGRESMEERIAIIFNSQSELITQLKYIIREKTQLDGLEQIYMGNASKKSKLNLLLEGVESEVYMENLFLNKNLQKLAMLWVAGVNVNWQKIYNGKQPKRMSIPTYPFEQKRYCFNDELEPILPNEVIEEITFSNNNVKVKAAQLLGVDINTIDNHVSLVKYGLDSITGMKLIAYIKDTYGLELTMKLMFKDASIDNITMLLESKVSTLSEVV